MNVAAWSPRARGGAGVLKRDGRLAAARRAGQQGARATLRAAAQKGVEGGNTARDQRGPELGAVIRGDEPGKRVNPSRVIVKSW